MRTTSISSLLGNSSFSFTQFLGDVRTKAQAYQRFLPKLRAAGPEQKVLRLSRNTVNASPTANKTETLESLSTTASAVLKRKINQKAKKSGHPDSYIAREYIAKELRVIDSRLEHEDADAVLEEYSTALSNFDSPNTQQWIIRLYSKDFIRLRLVARETGTSASKLAALLIAKAIQSQTLPSPLKKECGKQVVAA